MKQMRKIRLTDAQGKVLVEGGLSLISFSEESIVVGSIEFFRDPEPCFIHRGAVAVRYHAELDEFLSQLAVEGVCEIEWEQVPELHRERIAVKGLPVRLSFST